MENAKGMHGVSPAVEMNGGAPVPPPQLAGAMANGAPIYPSDGPPPYMGQQYYPPPPPTGYAQPYSNQPQYVQTAFVPVQTTTIVIDAIPNATNCPVCLRPTGNRIRRVSGGTAFCWFIILLLIFWPLCWLPFCMDSCQDV